MVLVAPRRPARGAPRAEPWLSGCQVLSGVICQAVRHCQALSGASVRPAVRCCQCCRVLSGACLTVEGLCSCRVLSELLGVAGSDAVGAVGAVRLLLLSDVGCCCQVLSGGAVGRRCQALTHTSHTYDTIKRRHQQDSTTIL